MSTFLSILGGVPIQTSLTYIYYIPRMKTLIFFNRANSPAQITLSDTKNYFSIGRVSPRRAKIVFFGAKHRSASIPPPKNGTFLIEYFSLFSCFFSIFRGTPFSIWFLNDFGPFGLAACEYFAKIVKNRGPD